MWPRLSLVPVVRKSQTLDVSVRGRDLQVQTAEDGETRLSLHGPSDRT